MAYCVAFLIGVFYTILIHEAGHYLMARLLNVKVLEFMVGYPFMRFNFDCGNHWGSKFTIRPLLFGGMVKFEENPPTNNPLKMIAIAIAGPATNIVGGLILVVFAYLLKGKGLDIALLASWKFLSASVTGLFDFLTGHGQSGDVVGPVGIVSVTGQALKQGLPYFARVVGAINISLGLANLLPLPPLDGAYMAIGVGELLSGRSLGVRYRQWLWSGGALVLFGVMLWTLYGDLLRIT